MSKFTELQATHEQLVTKLQSSEEILGQVQQYLKDIQAGSRQVSSARERDQLRANLRYWAGYVYEKTEEYPNVDLLPSVFLPDTMSKVIFFLPSGLLLLLFLYYVVFVLGPISRNSLVDQHIGTLVAQTQTASAWTPLPITRVPNQVLIIDEFNSAIRGVDGLDEAVDARFTIADIAFESYRNSPVTNLLRIQVECEWISKPSCTAERAFVVFVHAFALKKIRLKIIEEIPATITIIQIKAFDHLVPIGTIEIDLADLSAFLDGHITADQLVARMRRTNP